MAHRKTGLTSAINCSRAFMYSNRFRESYAEIYYSFDFFSHIERACLFAWGHFIYFYFYDWYSQYLCRAWSCVVWVPQFLKKFEAFLASSFFGGMLWSMAFSHIPVPYGGFFIGQHKLYYSSLWLSSFRQRMVTFPADWGWCLPRLSFALIPLLSKGMYHWPPFCPLGQHE